MYDRPDELMVSLEQKVNLPAEAKVKEIRKQGQS
jgi:hypothetical protein